MAAHSRAGWLALARQRTRARRAGAPPPGKIEVGDPIFSGLRVCSVHRARLALCGNKAGGLPDSLVAVADAPVSAGEAALAGGGRRGGAGGATGRRRRPPTGRASPPPQFSLSP